MYNGGIFSTDSVNSNTRPNVTLFMAARRNGSNPANYTKLECAFASIGDGLTDTEAANLYTAVQAYQTTLNRQIAP